MIYVTESQSVQRLRSQTMLTFTNKDPTKMKEILEREVKKTWFSENMIPANPKKFQSIVLGIGRDILTHLHIHVQDFFCNQKK